MKKLVYFFAVVALGIALLIQGCDIESGYNITVFNDTDSAFSVYLDGEFQFRLGANGSSIIKDVSGGSHRLEARDELGVVAEDTIELDEDIDWVVSIEKYEVEVVNETKLKLSVYMDGIFQFELPAGDSKNIIDVPAGTHTFDARVGNDIIASKTFDVDGYIEWIVYE